MALPSTGQSTAWFRFALCLHLAFCILNSGSTAHAQQLIDRVLARVGTIPVTMTDLRALIELGLIEVKPGEDVQAVALQRAIDRQLQLNEVARFSPPEPALTAIRDEMTAMKGRAGSRLPALVTEIGVDDAKLEQLARETLRIRAYIAQRFGASGQATADEARRYYDEHTAEFTRDGVLMPFDEAEPVARQRASAERSRTTIEQWIRDLRTRADVVIVGGGAALR